MNSNRVLLSSFYYRLFIKMVKGPVYSVSESAVLVVGDSLVEYVGDVRCDLEVVSLSGRG